MMKPAFDYMCRLLTGLHYTTVLGLYMITKAFFILYNPTHLDAIPYSIQVLISTSLLLSALHTFKINRATLLPFIFTLIYALALAIHNLMQGLSLWEVVTILLLLVVFYKMHIEANQLATLIKKIETLKPSVDPDTVTV